MRHPNGYGTVTKLQGNRRRPYIAKKTKFWNDKGHPVPLVIGYYKTREEGLLALAQYNNDPWNIDQKKITFEELYKLWLEKKASKLGISNQQHLKAAYKHCSRLFKTSYKELRSYHMQDVIDNCGFGSSSQSFIKNLFNHLDRFAFELDIISKRYSEILTTSPAPESNKLPFTQEEIDALWKISSKPWVDSVLAFLYTGFRISELLDIKIENVDLAAGTIKGGTKTNAGKNRIVPIHSLIRPFIGARVQNGGEYLFSIDRQNVKVHQYYIIWHDIMKQINALHTVHETRHTFRTMLDSAGANKRCIDLIMGHKSNDVGERVYTHKTLDELKHTVELITR